MPNDSAELCETCGEPIPACDCPNKSLDAASGDE